MCYVLTIQTSTRVVHRCVNTNQEKIKSAKSKTWKMGKSFIILVVVGFGISWFSFRFGLFRFVWIFPDFPDLSGFFPVFPDFSELFKINPDSSRCIQFQQNLSNNIQKYPGLSLFLTLYPDFSSFTQVYPYCQAQPKLQVKFSLKAEISLIFDISSIHPAGRLCCISLSAPYTHI